MSSSERTSKPSSSTKRSREPQEKEASKPSHKKSKKLAQEDNKGKAPEAEKSAKKGGGPIWTARDEVAFLKRLVACCEKGKGVPKNLGFFYETVRKDLDGGYNQDQLYNKLRGLRLKFDKIKDKIKDKIFVGFKDEHEESLYRMSKQVWGNREGDAEIGTEKAGKGGDARVEKKKNNLGGEREEVERNRNGDVGMASKEEGEEDESDGEEGEGEGHKGSSEDNGGEEEDSSNEGEESGSETTGDENSALPDSNAAQGLSERSKVAALGHHDDADAGENLSRPVQDGKPDGRKSIAPTNLPNNEDNLAQHAPTGMANGSPCVRMTDQLQMFDQLCKENMRILNSQLQDKLDGFKNEIVNMVKKELQSSSNNARPTGFDFSMIEEFFSARELPSLSKTEAEMLDQKWGTQKFIEMDAASKRLALMLEEYQLRMAKFSHQ